MSNEDETIMVVAEGEEGEEKDPLDYEDWNGVDEMPSMCMSCGAEGLTRLMLHKIPYFRELIIASFLCPECGERNNDVTFGGEIQPQGVVYTLTITNKDDLDRQIIKADSASVRIEELSFEIPPNTQKGGINTIEGVLKRASQNLAMYQTGKAPQCI